jgi:hypothetical protein
MVSFGGRKQLFCGTHDSSCETLGSLPLTGPNVGTDPSGTLTAKPESVRTAFAADLSVHPPAKKGLVFSEAAPRPGTLTDSSIVLVAQRHHDLVCPFDYGR